uniref:(northern house mosquito) hypothetical protein n=1 Tax=Culex pipiens TaxID=7175 RepID=A0A8D8NCB4_CULPI
MQKNMTSFIDIITSGFKRFRNKKHSNVKTIVSTPLLNGMWSKTFESCQSFQLANLDTLIRMQFHSNYRFNSVLPTIFVYFQKVLCMFIRNPFVVLNKNSTIMKHLNSRLLFQNVLCT